MRRLRDEETRGARFAGSSPPFLGRERAAVDVNCRLWFADHIQWALETHPLRDTPIGPQDQDDISGLAVHDMSA